LLQEVETLRNLAEVYGNAVAEWRPIVTEQVPALQQEVERWARLHGEACHWAVDEQARADAAEAEVERLTKERDDCERRYAEVATAVKSLAAQAVPPGEEPTK
jgi:hypothetical protein